MNILPLIIALPAAAGITSYFLRNNKLRRLLWAVTAAAHFGLSVKACIFDGYMNADQWIGIDSLSAVFISLTSLLFLVITIYGIGYVSREPVAMRSDWLSGGLFKNAKESVFTGCILLFLSAMSLSILSRHLALQWVAIEATTLFSAPLIYYHQTRRSLEAAWKYMLLCSVGIALALMGILFLSKSLPPDLSDITISGLMNCADQLNHKWLGIAFIFMIVGYGTKMGLAPLHTWLPDAHGEAPSVVSALLSGALLNCAFLGILRAHQVCAAAGMASFSKSLLIDFGLFSMGIAGVFLLMATDYKRMLAYSSVEHMGILALGVGIGGLGTFGALFHALNHSFVKAMLFLTAGNILSRFHTKNTAGIQGLCRAMPVSGVLWVLGFLAITGSPPFGTFISEFTILNAAVSSNLWMITTLYVSFILLAFIGMAKIVLRMALGKSDLKPQAEPLSAVLPPMVFTAVALILGLYLPDKFVEMLNGAAILIGGGAK